MSFVEPDLAHQHRRLRLLVPVHRVLRAPRWGLEHPGVLLGPGRHHAAPLSTACREVRQQRVPAGAVAVAPRRPPSSPRRSQPLCSISMRVRSPRPRRRSGCRPRWLGAVPPQVPPVGQAAGRLPHRHLAPRRARTPADVARRSGRPADSRARSRRDLPVTVWSGGHQVPIRDVHTANACWGGQSTSKVMRSGAAITRAGRSVFSASSRNRAAALPQTPSRYSWTARSPSSSQVVDPAVPLRLLGHHPRVLQQAQVARDGGAADGQGGRDLVHRLVAVAQQPQDLAPRRVAQRVERVPRWGTGSVAGSGSRALRRHR